jgi:hypothetical protein
MKTSRFVSIVVVSAALSTPAFANYFSNPNLGLTANIGSAPNPRPADLRSDGNLPRMVVTRAKSQMHLVQFASSLPRTYSTDAVQSAPAPKMSPVMMKPDSDDSSGGFFSWLWDWNSSEPKMSEPAPAPRMSAPAPMHDSDDGSGGFFSFEWLPF